MSKLAGRTLGNFVVEEEIGRGGMGVVLRARQPRLDRLAVLKKVRRELAEVPELAERFAREARAAGSVHHPNVVTVYDHFSWRGDHYIAQEYVDGVDLSQALAKIDHLPWRQAALIVLEIARGLEEIHAQGTVHRDLKPSNILLGRRGEVKIADFGVAIEVTGSKLTQPGTLVGTPPYLAPEQLRGERADTRSDLFALGVVFYELLAGTCPYPELEDEDTRPLLRSMEQEEYPSLNRVASGVPRSGARLLRHCLRAKPSRRLASARELRSRLEQFLGCPSPADARSEIAIHLWEQGVFQKRENQTLVLAPAVPAVSASASGVGWLPTAFALLFICATILLVDVRPVVPPMEQSAPSSRTTAFTRPETAETRALRAAAVATPFDPMLDRLGAELAEARF